MVGNLRINGDRLWSSIMETARFGATPNGGINRLTLTKEDAAVRHWFKEQTETLGCKVIVDEVGNMFAIRSEIVLLRPNRRRARTAWGT